MLDVSMRYFKTVQEMKQATNLVAGDFVQTLGFHKVGDCGDANYLIKEKNVSEVIDNASIIEINNTNLVAELIIRDKKVNVLQFGAVSGTLGNLSTADSTESFQKAIDYLARKGLYNLYIPSGVYYISSVKITNVKTNVKINFFGDGITSSWIYSINNNPSTAIIDASNCYESEFHDFIIRGNKNNQIKEITGLYINSTTNLQDLKIYNVRVDNCSGNGAYISKAQSHLMDTLINNCIFYSNKKYGLEMNGSTDASINECRFANNGFSGLVIRMGSNIVSNCKSYLNGVGTDEQNRYHGYELLSSSNMLSNCEAQENYGDGFYIRGSRNILSNCKADANGITGFNEDGTRKKREETVEARYAGFRIQKSEGTRITGAITCFINTNTYGIQQKYGLYIDASSKNIASLIVEPNAAEIEYELNNTTLDTCSLEINNKLMNPEINYEELPLTIVEAKNGGTLNDNSKIYKIGKQIYFKLIFSYENPLEKQQGFRVCNIEKSYAPEKDINFIEHVFTGENVYFNYDKIYANLTKDGGFNANIRKENQKGIVTNFSYRLK